MRRDGQHALARLFFMVIWGYGRIYFCRIRLLQRLTPLAQTNYTLVLISLWLAKYT